MTTIAVYGGSFNPPHIGHAMVVQWILWTEKADKVLLVPSAHHPLGKEHGRPLAERMRLLRAMASDIARDGPVFVSGIEREWDGPVYTYDLLAKLKQEHPEAQFRFVIGADILGETHRWHKWDKVRAEYDLIVLGREGYPSPDGSPIIPDFSSSEVRRLMGAGDDRWRSMVTPGVRRILTKADEPRDCPFCGGPATTEAREAMGMGDSDSTRVGCPACNVWKEQLGHGSEQAVAEWNGRV